MQGGINVDKDKRQFKSLFQELTEAMGVSGHEQEVIHIIHKHIKPWADEVKVSTVGNIVAIKRGNKPGPSVAIAAHMDEVGYLVRNILPNGYLTLEKVGSPPDSIAVGRKVWISSKRIPGVIGTKPAHMQTPEQAKMITPLTRNYVDIGVSSAQEARDLGIKIGDQVVIQSDFMEMSNPDLICTRAVDNRVNCAVIIELFKKLKSNDFSGTLYGVFTIREEVGLHGARCALFDYDIDYVLALDTIPVADTPDANPVNDLPIFLGKGPGLVVCEGIYPLAVYQYIHPGIRDLIEKEAAKTGINLQTVTLSSVLYMTDATAYAYVKGGLPVATLTVPRRYSHAPVELTDINDSLSLIKLLESIVRNNDNIDLNFVKL